MELIDKDKLNDYKFRSVSERMDLPVEYMFGWNEAIDRIQANAQTVEAEPVRHGIWLEFPEALQFEALTDDDIACNVCGHAFNVIDNNTEEFNYCPWCGAKMDGAEE